MSRKEALRAGLIKAACGGEISNAEGAAALRLSVRQVQRLKRRYEADDVRGLLHRSRGRPSPRARAIEVRDRGAELLQTTYHDVNDCHLTEKLCEVEGLPISRAAVRRIRCALGLPAKRRRRPRQYRCRRTPAARMGALVQLDGSPFAWLEARGPAMTLHGAIDDATGTVLVLYFRPTEDLHGYVTLLQWLGTHYGLPLALYGDRLGVFVRNDRHWTLEEELQGAQHPTHFGQILRALGIAYLAAGSPQAKGRIERLWLTLQDRLVVELRLRGITTLEAANAFLPAFLADYNPRFAHAPAEATPVWRRPPRDFADLLSCGYTRRVARDHTVRLGPRTVQLPPGRAGRGYAGTRVELRECLDGRLVVTAHGQRLMTQPTPGPAFTLGPRSHPQAERQRRLRAPQAAAARRGGHEGMARNPKNRRPSSRPSAPLRPAATHPWRRAARAAAMQSLTRRSPQGVTLSLNS
jgi:transposase